MWRTHLKRTLDRHGGVVHAAVGASLFVAAWFAVGALAHPTHFSPAPAPSPASTPLVSNTAPVAPTTDPLPLQTFERYTPEQAQLINASVPLSTLPNPAAKPFSLEDASPADRVAAQTCLSMAIYYEAASQSAQGQAAVAQVVLNRVRNPLFPKTVCGVVFQGSTLATGCQFTFTCDGSLKRTPSATGWKRAEQIAQRALSGYVEASVGEATHYHTMWVVPYWESTLVKVNQIGAHIFYRWGGRLGMPGAFLGQYANTEPRPASLGGFDTGPEAPVIGSETPVAKIEPPPRQVPVEVAIETPAPTGPPTQLAMLTSPAPLALATGREQADKPKGFFGRRGGTEQRLAAPGRW